MGLDPSKLTPEQRDKLELYNMSKDQGDAIKALEQKMQTFTPEMQMKISNLADLKQDLTPILDALKALADKEQPDTTTAVVEAVGKLETALKAIDFKPSFTPKVKVDAPQVAVTAPEIDLSGVEQAVREVSVAVKEAVSQIPAVEVPETDFSPLVDKLDAMLEQLADIDKGVRLKPEPGTMKVTNSDGSAINSTVIEGVVSDNNSTTVLLPANGVFTGRSDSVKNYAAIQVMVFSDQASATDGLSMQQSTDGSHWDAVDTYTIAASTGKLYSVQPGGNYFRIVYTNGSTGQGAFRLSTVYHTVTPKPSSQRAGDAVSNENDLEQVSAWLMGFNGTTWDRVRIDGNKYLVTTVGAVELATAYNAVENDVDISVKASAGYLLSTAVTNYNATKRYFQIHNKATAPAGTDVPVFSYPIPAGTANAPGSLILDEMFFGPGGYYCSIGISLGISTTAATFTAATTTDHVIGGVYV